MRGEEREGRRGEERKIKSHIPISIPVYHISMVGRYIIKYIVVCAVLLTSRLLDQQDPLIRLKLHYQVVLLHPWSN